MCFFYFKGGIVGKSTAKSLAEAREENPVKKVEEAKPEIIPNVGVITAITDRGPGVLHLTIETYGDFKLHEKYELKKIG